MMDEWHTVHGFDMFVGGGNFQARSTAVCALALMHEVGLSDRIVPANDAAKKRFILSGGKLQALPNHPLGALSPLMRPVVGAVLRNFLLGRLGSSVLAPQDDMSVGEFARTRLNAHTASLLLDPMVAGIWSGDVDQLSVSACFPMLKYHELMSPRGSFVANMVTPLPHNPLRVGRARVTTTAEGFGSARAIEREWAALGANPPPLV